MDKTALVGKDIEIGKKIIEALDNAKFDVRAALWFYLSDSDRWRFIVASPIVDKKGPKKAYEAIQSILNKSLPELPESGISLNDISVVSPKDELIRLLRSAIRTNHKITSIRFRQSTINNIFIDDVYIYRML